VRRRVDMLGPGTRPAQTACVRDPVTRLRSGSVRRPPRLLIVDDERLLAESLRRILSDDMVVTTTSDPIGLVERLAAGERYDVILCDVNMPALNGVDLLERVEARAPGHAERFIFMTGGVADGMLQARLESLGCRVIEKPLDLKVLRSSIWERFEKSGPPISEGKAG